MKRLYSSSRSGVKCICTINIHVCDCDQIGSAVGKSTGCTKVYYCND